MNTPDERRKHELTTIVVDNYVFVGMKKRTIYPKRLSWLQEPMS